MATRRYVAGSADEKSSRKKQACSSLFALFHQAGSSRFTAVRLASQPSAVASLSLASRAAGFVVLKNAAKHHLLGGEHFVVDLAEPQNEWSTAILQTPASACMSRAAKHHLTDLLIGALFEARHQPQPGCHWSSPQQPPVREVQNVRCCLCTRGCFRLRAARYKTTRLRHTADI